MSNNSTDGKRDVKNKLTGVDPLMSMSSTAKNSKQINVRQDTEAAMRDVLEPKGWMIQKYPGGAA